MAGLSTVGCALFCGGASEEEGEIVELEWRDPFWPSGEVFHSDLAWSSLLWHGVSGQPWNSWGTVVLIFQPAEERGIGAKDMIKEGALEDVDAIFGLHLVHSYPIGVVASRPGVFLAGCGGFKATIKGKGGHAAIPQDSVDPILAASTSIISLQNIISRETNPLDSQVVSVAMIQAGFAFNIIPESATLAGTFRSLSKEGFHSLRKRIEEVIKAQAGVHRCSAEVEFFGHDHPTIPPTINDERIYEQVKHMAHEIVGEDNTKLAPTFTGSEDFAFFLDEVPGSFLLVGMGNQHKNAIYPPHSPYFFIDEDVLPIGAALHAAFAHSYFSQSSRSISDHLVSHSDEL